jgi:hypothetical protein
MNAQTQTLHRLVDYLNGATFHIHWLALSAFLLGCTLAAALAVRNLH